MAGPPPDTDPLPFERPLGAHPLRGGGFEVRIWAPRASAVHVVLGDPDRPDDPARLHRAEPEGHGVWTCRLSWAQPGQRYWIDLDGSRWADPWSRSQPSGTAGPSALVDPAAIGAVAPGTAGRPPRPTLSPRGAVVYELHVGTFSATGDFAGVIDHLPELAALGVTHLELLPVAEFPGHRGWGYDGIFWSAAESTYGGPGRLVQLVDAAHEAGLGVILDVVYNHVGPTGDLIYDAYGPFFTDRHGTPWGQAVNVDGAGSGGMRETILQNAEWWIGEVGVDGLRVDACHAIVDQGARHVLGELTSRARAVHPQALLVAESGLNDPHVQRDEAHGGWGFSADWSDDFHHALRTLLTDDRQAWYADFGAVAQLAKAYHRPLVHDGTWSGYRDRRFGAPADDLAPERFVVFAQNHDQVGNRPLGDRLPQPVRALAALCTLFAPFTPMLFMGEEYGEDAPFLFFSDHQEQFLADATREGRRAEFADFTAATGEEVPDPQAADTFERSRLTRRVDQGLADLYRRLLALRPLLPRTEVTVAFDEAARWLRVERGTSVLLANFADVARSVPCPPGRVELATDASIASPVSPADPHLLLPARSGALVWKAPPTP
ncbi:malto-oligosyltrehalose trehalohydrolase [Aquihabitans sp. G128]|uniref:malto-oligosyltrehalose trehalohydrolase n=1 Tax=Aquihabitans sp. G128 TaxID=2849779 RepID=UPI001C2248CA|nr:malto-oligosyltrehalose trehalohydrolase [Aquihabitans sp. G128]QXC59779.1 malto-oligosyltrehalose trehalohydrolase [Aquihabitans sp. G128]